MKNKKQEISKILKFLIEDNYVEAKKITGDIINSKISNRISNINKTLNPKR